MTVTRAAGFGAVSLHAFQGSGTCRPHDHRRMRWCVGAPALLEREPNRVYRTSAREDTAGVRIISSQGEAGNVSTE